MPLRLSDADRDEAVASLQDYVRTEMDHDIGALAAGFLLDFVLAEIGPSVYNRAIADAQAHLQARLAELDVDLHETEFPLARRTRRS